MFKKVTGETTIEYVSALSEDVSLFNQKTVIIQNTDAAHPLLCQVIAYAYPGGNPVELLVETELLAAAIITVSDNDAYHTLVVQVGHEDPENVGGLKATYQIDFIGIGDIDT